MKHVTYIEGEYFNLLEALTENKNNTAGITYPPQKMMMAGGRMNSCIPSFEYDLISGIFTYLKRRLFTFSR